MLIRARKAAPKIAVWQGSLSVLMRDRLLASLYGLRLGQFGGFARLTVTVMLQQVLRLLQILFGGLELGRGIFCGAGITCRGHRLTRVTHLLHRSRSASHSKQAGHAGQQ